MARIEAILSLNIFDTKTAHMGHFQAEYLGYENGLNTSHFQNKYYGYETARIEAICQADYRGYENGSCTIHYKAIHCG